MSLDATKVRVGVTGAVYKAATSTSAPTSVSSALTSFTDLGYVSEDGVTITLPEAGDRTPIKGWQGDATVRVIRGTTDDNPTVQFTLLETSLAVIETYFGSTATQTVTDGSVEFDTTDTRGYLSFVIDVVDGSDTIRTYVPYGVVTSVGDLVYKNQEPIGYQVTVECERDTTKSYNLKQWLSPLHS